MKKRTKDSGSRKPDDESRHRNICDPRRRTDRDGEDIKKSPGGKGANQAVQMARLGQMLR